MRLEISGVSAPNLKFSGPNCQRNTPTDSVKPGPPPRPEAPLKEPSLSSIFKCAAGIFGVTYIISQLPTDIVKELFKKGKEFYHVYLTNPKLYAQFQASAPDHPITQILDFLIQQKEIFDQKDASLTTLEDKTKQLMEKINQRQRYLKATHANHNPLTQFNYQDLFKDILAVIDALEEKIKRLEIVQSQFNRLSVSEDT